MRINIRDILLLPMIAFIFISCEKNSTSSKTGPLYLIEVMPATHNVVIDSTVQFTAVGKDIDGNEIKGLSFNWEVASIDVAMIDNDGVVTGIAMGVTTITAKLQEVESSPANVSVTEGRGTLTDMDGNTYKSVKIGNQWWMAENLKVTHYRNGEAIPTGYSDSEWVGLSTGAYAVYGDNASNVDTYGLLYNWYAVNDNRNLAPEGWHLPTDAEWKQLEMYLGMSRSEAHDTGFRGTNEGSKLAGSADLWRNDSLEYNSEFGWSGFTALPGGFRLSHTGIYGGLREDSYFWLYSEETGDDACNRVIVYDIAEVYRNFFDKRFGFSVRCVRDS